MSLLHGAVQNGHLNVCVYLVETCTFDVNFHNEEMRVSTPLYLACLRRQLKVAKYLLKHGANVDGEERYQPLALAAQSGFEDMCELLLENGADVTWQEPNKLGFSALQMAVQNGHTGIVKLLYRFGARVEHVYLSDGMVCFKVL
jgi:ankyrin repeat protein